jgi:hypothetical protein
VSSSGSWKTICIYLLERHSRKFTRYKFFFLFDYLKKRVTNIHIFFRFNSFVERHSGKFILIYIIFSFILLTVKKIYTNTPIIKSFFFSLTTWNGWVYYCCYFYCIKEMHTNVPILLFVVSKLLFSSNRLWW